MKARVVRAAAIAVAVPLILWFNVWAAFQFGEWISVVAPTPTQEPAVMLGVLAFGVLCGSQAFASFALTDKD